MSTLSRIYLLWSSHISPPARAAACPPPQFFPRELLVSQKACVSLLRNLDREKNICGMKYDVFISYRREVCDKYARTI